jgi:hypothetical protein
MARIVTLDCYKHNNVETQWYNGMKLVKLHAFRFYEYQESLAWMSRLLLLSADRNKSKENFERIIPTKTDEAIKLLF